MKALRRSLSLSLVATLATLCMAAPAAAQSGPAAPASAPGAGGAGAGASSTPALPPKECLDALDRLSKGVPREESGPVLRSKGLRISTPIVVSERVIINRSVTSAVRVRAMIAANGRVVPGSVEIQAAEGDLALPRAIQLAVEATLSFDTSGAFTVPPQFPFTTVYVHCARP